MGWPKTIKFQAAFWPCRGHSHGLGHLPSLGDIFGSLSCHPGVPVWVSFRDTFFGDFPSTSADPLGRGVLRRLLFQPSNYPTSLFLSSFPFPNDLSFQLFLSSFRHPNYLLPTGERFYLSG